MVYKLHLPGRMTYLCDDAVLHKLTKVRFWKIFKLILFSLLFNERHTTSMDNDQPPTVACRHGKREVRQKERLYSGLKVNFLPPFGHVLP